MEQILLAYGLPRETVATIMMLYRNSKVKVRSPDGDRLLQHCSRCDKLAPHLFNIFQDYVLRTSIDLMKENGFKLAKERSRREPVQTLTDVGYANDIALLVNSPAQAETLVHSLEWAADGIGLHVNADKTEYTCFNQRGDITLDGDPLELVVKFSYLGSSSSSTENYINTRLAEAWTAIDKLSVTWKSNLTDRIKHSFFQPAFGSIQLYGCTT